MRRSNRVVIALALVTLACGSSGGGEGSGASSGIGILWATNTDLEDVRRLDTSSGDVETIDLAGEQPDQLATGAGAVWVTMKFSPTVLRIDPKTSAISATIPVGVALRGIAANADGVWVTDDGNSDTTTGTPSVHRIDPATNKLVASIPFEIADEPVNIAIGPAGVYVMIWNAFSVARIDPAANTLVKRVPLGHAGSEYGYGELAISGGSVWALDQYGYALTELDATTLDTKHEAPGDARYSGDMVVAGGKIFVADIDGDKVVELDPSTGAVAQELDATGTPWTMSAKGSTLIVGLTDTSGGNVLLFDAASGKKLADLPAFYPDDIAPE